MKLAKCDTIRAGNSVPYEVFAEKVKVLLPHYYAELMDYLEFLIAKSQMQERKENIQNTDENRKRAFDTLKKYKASLPENFDYTWWHEEEFANDMSVEDVVQQAVAFAQKQ